MLKVCDFVSFDEDGDVDVGVKYQRSAVDNDDDGRVSNHDVGNHDDDDDCNIDDDGEIAKLVRLCRQCASYEEQLCFQSHRGY